MAQMLLEAAARDDEGTLGNTVSLRTEISTDSCRRGCRSLRRLVHALSARMRSFDARFSKSCSPKTVFKCHSVYVLLGGGLYGGPNSTGLGRTCLALGAAQTPAEFAAVSACRGSLDRRARESSLLEKLLASSIEMTRSCRARVACARFKACL